MKQTSFSAPASATEPEVSNDMEVEEIQTNTAMVTNQQRPDINTFDNDIKSDPLETVEPSNDETNTDMLTDQGESDNDLMIDPVDEFDSPAHEVIEDKQMNENDPLGMNNDDVLERNLPNKKNVLKHMKDKILDEAKQLQIANEQTRSENIIVPPNIHQNEMQDPITDPLTDASNNPQTFGSHFLTPFLTPSTISYSAEKAKSAETQPPSIFINQMPSRISILLKPDPKIIKLPKRDNASPTKSEPAKRSKDGLIVNAICPTCNKKVEGRNRIREHISGHVQKQLTEFVAEDRVTCLICKTYKGSTIQMTRRHIALSHNYVEKYGNEQEIEFLKSFNLLRGVT